MLSYLMIVLIWLGIEWLLFKFKPKDVDFWLWFCVGPFAMTLIAFEIIWDIIILKR